jgi:hypothetical protein
MIQETRFPESKQSLQSQSIEKFMYSLDHPPVKSTTGEMLCSLGGSGDRHLGKTDQQARKTHLDMVAEWLLSSSIRQKTKTWHSNPYQETIVNTMRKTHGLWNMAKSQPF